MAVLFDDTLEVETPHTVDANGASFELAGIPFEDFGTGTLRVTIEVECKQDPYSVFNIVTLYAYVNNAGIDDSGHTRDFTVDAIGVLFANSAGAFTVQTMADEFPTSGHAYVEFNGTGTPQSIYFWAPVLPPEFHEGAYTFKNIHVTVEGDEPAPEITVEITDPPSDTEIEPDDALTFVVENDGLPDVLTADVTLADGSVKRAWDFDQAVNGYIGTLEVDGTTRTYTIQRPIGWVLGALSLAVHAEAGDSEADDDAAWTVGPTSGRYVEQALSRVIIQYRNSPKLLAVVRLHASIFQQLENCLLEIPRLDDPDQASGVNLDVTGELVGQNTRQFGNGDIATDEQMRMLIRARVSRNHTHATGPNLKAILEIIFDANVEVNDLGGMAASYGIGRVPTANEVAVLDHDILARPMGVRVDRYYFDDTDYFGFAHDAAAKGYGDTDTDPDGGGYAHGF